MANRQRREKWEITPLHRFGPVELGSSRSDARRTFEGAPDAYKKGPQGPSVDAWHQGTIQIFYAKGGRRVEYVEATRSDPRPFEPWFMDLPLFETPADEVIATLTKTAAYDHRHPEVGYSYVFHEWELALWRPAVPEDDPAAARFFATVGVGVAGYYSGRKE